MKSLSIIAAVFMMLGFVSGCHTMEGFGKDVQKGGKNIEKSADRNK